MARQVQNSIVQQKENNVGFTATINMPSVRQMIDKAIGNPDRAASFVSTLISTVNANRKLAECEPASVISAALRGEAMRLSLPLGQYSIIPYGNTANFQLSYKGLAQLAIRSGRYADIGVFDVRQGEYKGKDPRTRRPNIEWLDDDERERLPIQGFYGFYELKDGFTRSVYWGHEKILTHADKYSKAFSYELYSKMLKGEMKDDEKAKLRGGSPWYDDPTSEGHMKMCRKTVLIQMLSDGIAPLSLELQTALDTEKASEQSEVIYADDPVVIAVNKADETEKKVDVDTGEIIIESKEVN